MPQMQSVEQTMVLQGSDESTSSGEESWAIRLAESTVGTLRFTLRSGHVQALSSGETELQGIVDGLAQRIRAKQRRSSKE